MIFGRNKTIAEYMNYYDEVRVLQRRATSAQESGNRRLEKNLLDKLIIAIDTYESNVPKKLRETESLSEMSSWKNYSKNRFAQLESKLNQPSRF